MDRQKAVNLIIVLALLIVVLLIPFLFRQKGEEMHPDARQLIVLSPHNEAIRHEFEAAFRRWHEKHFGEIVDIDWRNMGGTSEVIRYIDSEFEAAERGSRDGIGIDLLFGGGKYDHARQALMGHTVPCGLRRRHPEWLSDDIIPQYFSGERFYDQEDRWYGCCLSSFGICYNEDVIRCRGIQQNPQRWIDLADFHFFSQIALADPTKSGSINKAFEMLIQEQMMEELRLRNKKPHQASNEDLAAGWRRGLNVIRRIGANTRYFTDSASKVPIDVAQGNAAAGMCIDFYGRFESETVQRNEHSSRMNYLTPSGGSSVSVDPISMIRGAPDRELAERFIDFCLSEQGQQLWNYRVGEPGGPVRYALRRLPIRRDMYNPEHLRHMSDSGAMPYQRAGLFTYHAEWTGSLFGLIRVLIRTMCLDTHDELVAAWEAIHKEGGPSACPEAVSALMALPAGAEYGEAKAITAQRVGDKLDEIRIAREWVVFFRSQYQKAERLAKGKTL